MEPHDAVLTEIGHQFQDESGSPLQHIKSLSATASVRADFEHATLAIDRHATVNTCGGYFQNQVALTRTWKAVSARAPTGSRSVETIVAPVQPIFSRTDRSRRPARRSSISQPTSRDLYQLQLHVFCRRATLGSR